MKGFKSLITRQLLDEAQTIAGWRIQLAAAALPAAMHIANGYEGVEASKDDVAKMALQYGDAVLGLILKEALEG